MRLNQQQQKISSSNSIENIASSLNNESTIKESSSSSSSLVSMKKKKERPKLIITIDLSEERVKERKELKIEIINDSPEKSEEYFQLIPFIR